MFKKIVIILLSIVILSTITSCGKDIETTIEKNIEENLVHEESTKTKSLTVLIENFDKNINPILNTDKNNEYINNLIFDGLVSIDNQGKIIPKIAYKWDISDDLYTYTFHINKGIKFHDGIELTTKDIKYTYEILKNSNYDGNRFKINKNSLIKEIKIIDEYTVSFKLNTIDSSLLYGFDLGILPMHVHKTKDIPKNITIGSGPYKFNTTDDDTLHLEKFDDYYFNPLKINEIKIIKYISENSIEDYFLEQNIDICKVPLGYRYIDNIKNIKNIDIKHSIDNSYSFIGFNINSPLFYDKNIRKALTYGLDREFFVREVYKEYGVVSNSPMLKDTWAYNKNTNKYYYNPKKASELLKSSNLIDTDGDGWLENKNGLDYSIKLLTYKNSNYSEKLSNILKNNYKDLGVKVDVEYVEFDELIKRVYEDRNFDLFTMALEIGIEPDPIPVFSIEADIYGGLNAAGYYNEEAEEIFNMMKNQFDQNERKKLYNRWAEIVNDELPFIFISYKPEIWLVNDRVKNFSPKVFYDWSYQIENIELK